MAESTTATCSEAYSNGLNPIKGVSLVVSSKKWNEQKSSKKPVELLGANLLTLAEVILGGRDIEKRRFIPIKRRSLNLAPNSSTNLITPPPLVEINKKYISL